MQMEQHIHSGLEAHQRLSLNTGVMQSLRILQMTMQELREFLIDKSYENPFVELSDSPPFEEQRLEVRSHSKTSMADEREDYFETGTAPHEIRSTAAANDEYLSTISNSEPLFTDILKEQLRGMNLEPSFSVICHFLVDCLDRKGYLVDDPEEMADLIGCSLFDLMQAVYVLQSLEPAGVGAQSLEECLLLQLVQFHGFCPHTIRLVKDGLKLLATGNISGIASLLETDERTAIQATHIVQGLNPIPSQGYYTGEGLETTVPDVFVERGEDGLHIRYNQAVLPKASLNIEYISLISTLPIEEEKTYLRHSLEEARQIVHALEKRENTLSRIIGQIVHLQPRFFEDGLTLRPMTLDSVAAGLGMNVSTISRAIQGKTVKCPAGTLSIKSLFSGGVRSQAEEAVSVSLVKRMIQSLISEEVPSCPLSDEKIRQLLQAAKIDISRRTIAKYRESLKILPSHLRKSR